MPTYAIFMKNLVSNKQLVEDETIEVIHHCSAIIPSNLVKKKKVFGAFTILCTIILFTFANAYVIL